MEEDFELNIWNVLKVLENQITNPEFNGMFDYVPFKEVDKDGVMEIEFSQTLYQLIGLGLRWYVRVSIV